MKKNLETNLQNIEMSLQMGLTLTVQVFESFFKETVFYYLGLRRGNKWMLLFHPNK